MSQAPPLEPSHLAFEFRANRLSTALAAALFIATAAFTLWQNSRVAVLWDISYLLDSSFRISLGQVPYRDFPFAHAPLTFLLHAAIIHLFGRVYFPHILCAAVEAGLATVLTWRILLKLTQENKFVATLLAAPLTVLGIYAIYPHPIYDSDCILAVLFALYLLQRAAERPLRNALAGAACVLPFFTKQNIGLPFLLATFLAIAVIAIFRRIQYASIAPQLCFFAGATFTLAAALLLLHCTVGVHNYLYWTITFATQRRLPGLRLILETYHQASLLWTIPAAIIALILLRTRQENYLPEQNLSDPELAAQVEGESMAESKNQRLVERPRNRWVRHVAIFLLAAPFLWIIAALAFTTDVDDRSDQLLSLWPHLLLLAEALAVYNLLRLRTQPVFNSLLPLILLASIHGAFLSQQLWGSTYAAWPLLILLIAAMLTQIPNVARPLTAIIAATLLVCGGLYASSHERLSYAQLDGPRSSATLPQLRGLTTPGPWIPAFEELIRFTATEIPATDGILLLPGEDPFYFATGRIPQFPVLLFDPATDPYTPQQTLEQARAHDIRWLIVTRNLQLTASPKPDLPEVLATLQQDFAPYQSLTNYDIYRRK